MTGIHARLLGVRHTASDSILKTAIFIGVTRIRLALQLVGVGVTNAPFSASLIRPKGPVVVVMVAIESADTVGQGNTGGTIQDEPWVTLAGLYTSQDAEAAVTQICLWQKVLFLHSPIWFRAFWQAAA